MVSRHAVVQALEQCILLSKYPKSAIDIHVFVLESDGGKEQFIPLLFSNLCIQERCQQQLPVLH